MNFIWVEGPKKYNLFEEGPEKYNLFDIPSITIRLIYKNWTTVCRMTNKAINFYETLRSVNYKTVDSLIITTFKMIYGGRSSYKILESSMLECTFLLM